MEICGTRNFFKSEHAENKLGYLFAFLVLTQKIVTPTIFATSQVTKSLHKFLLM